MNGKSIIRTGAAIACLLIFLLAIQVVSAGSYSEKPDIEGSWKSVGPEDFHDGTFGTRIFNFENTSWNETIIIYSDRELQRPLYRIYYEGYFEITTDHATMYRTHYINFHFSKKTLTILTDDKEVVKELGFRNCRPDKDVEVDVSEKGCGMIRSIQEYPVHYDIVKKDLDFLFFGIHAAEDVFDSPEKRPAYFHYPLRKFNPKKESEWVKNQKTVYVLLYVNVRDDAAFDEYSEGHIESMHKYGGMEVFQSDNNESIQGENHSDRLMIQIWPDREQFEKWWNSKDFASWKNLLLKTNDVRVTVSGRTENQKP